MDPADISVSVETVDPFAEPEEYGLGQIKAAVQTAGLDVPPDLLDDLVRQLDEGVEEQAGFRDWFRSVGDEIEVLRSWTVERVVPILVVAAPAVAGVELEVSCSSTASESGSILLKLPGVELGANSKLTVSSGVTIEASAGEIRQFGARVPFIIDRVAVAGNPDRGNWLRASVGAGKHVPVVEKLKGLPEGLGELGLELDASRDDPSGGASFSRSHTLATGASASISLGWGGDDGGKNSLSFAVERETEQKVALKAKLPGGVHHRGAWLLGPAGVRIG